MKHLQLLLLGTVLSFTSCQEKDQQKQVNAPQKNPFSTLSDYQGLERQILLNEISSEIEHPFKSLEYDPDGSKLKNYTNKTLIELGVNTEKIKRETGGKDLTKGNYSARVVDLTMSFPNQTAVPLFIGTELFNQYGMFSKDDLKHIIIYHEGTHAKQLSERTPFSKNGRRRNLIHKHNSSTRFDYLICDAEARHTEFSHFNDSNITTEYKRQTARNFLMGYYELQQMELSEKQKEAIEAVPHIFTPKTLKYATHYAK